MTPTAGLVNSLDGEQSFELRLRLTQQSLVRLPWQIRQHPPSPRPPSAWTDLSDIAWSLPLYLQLRLQRHWSRCRRMRSLQRPHRICTCQQRSLTVKPLTERVWACCDAVSCDVLFGIRSQEWRQIGLRFQLRTPVDKPLPMLLVNLVMLSVMPNTVFLAKLVAPCGRQLSSIIGAYSCNAKSNILVAMHDDALVRLVEDVGHTGADIVEQANWIAEEVRRTQHTIDLRHELILVVQHHTLL